MANKWPSFVTKDLGNTPDDDAEMQRRWENYNREMKALIAAGGVHQDADGWWVDDKTGELIGPDPEIERPTTDDELRQAKPFREVFPDLAASIDRELAKRGRPKAEQTKQPVTIRLDPDIVDHYKATGKGWQSRMNDDLRKMAGL
jgi:uncharacterized protein (DUF4415 family)